MSANFKTQAKVAETFSNKLDLGDTLDFRMIHHCGSGVRFNIINSFVIHGTAKGLWNSNKSNRNCS